MLPPAPQRLLQSRDGEQRRGRVPSSPLTATQRRPDGSRKRSPRPACRGVGEEPVHAVLLAYALGGEPLHRAGPPRGTHPAGAQPRRPHARLFAFQKSALLPNILLLCLWLPHSSACSSRLSFTVSSSRTLPAAAAEPRHAGGEGGVRHSYAVEKRRAAVPASRARLHEGVQLTPSWRLRSPPTLPPRLKTSQA